MTPVHTPVTRTVHPASRSRCGAQGESRQAQGQQDSAPRSGIGPVTGGTNSRGPTRHNCVSAAAPVDFAPRKSPAPRAGARRAVSSAVEHCFHTAGVTGSIPVPPTKSTHFSVSCQQYWQRSGADLIAGCTGLEFPKARQSLRRNQPAARILRSTLPRFASSRACQRS